MPNWQVTATTVRCDAVGDEVTLLVYKDWTVKCTGFPKYRQNGHGRAGSKASSAASGCHGTECGLALEYKQKLQAEETRG